MTKEKISLRLDQELLNEVLRKYPNSTITGSIEECLKNSLLPHSEVKKIILNYSVF